MALGIVLRPAQQPLRDEAAHVVVVLRQAQPVLHVTRVHREIEVVAQLTVHVRAQRNLSLMIDRVDALLAQEVAGNEILRRLRPAAGVDAVPRPPPANEDAVLLERVEREATGLLAQPLRYELI